MRVFFLPGAYDGCYYYRGYLPGIASGHKVVLDFSSNKFNQEILYEECMKADVIVMQRPNEPIRANLARLLKKKGKKIIFENDDTYLPDKGVPLNMLPNQKQKDLAVKMNNHLYSTVKIADAVVASTPLLAEEYKSLNKNVHVIPNFIDPLDEEPKQVNDTGKYRVGFIGSVASNDDYTHIKDQITRLAMRGDITIVIFGIKQKSGRILTGYKDDYDFWSNLPNIEWQPFVPMTNYYHTLASLKLDLIMIPRKESYFNRCKSNIKFLEASLLRIPVVAQGFTTNDSPYEQNPEDSKHMVLVKDNSWYESVVDLLENKEKRDIMAENAHDYVINNYNINDHTHLWEQVLQTI